MIKMGMSGPIVEESGNCHFCGKEVDSDFYCYGCGEYVCEECDEKEPWGPHSIEDHKND